MLPERPYVSQLVNNASDFSTTSGINDKNMVLIIRLYLNLLYAFLHIQLQGKAILCFW